MARQLLVDGNRLQSLVGMVEQLAQHSPQQRSVKKLERS
jgi:hypothetical protein